MIKKLNKDFFPSNLNVYCNILKETILLAIFRAFILKYVIKSAGCDFSRR